MRNKFALAASITAAALALGACKNDDNESNKTYSAEYQRMLDSVETVSIAPAYDDATLAAELQKAQDITGDSLDNKGFLSLTYNVTTKNNERLMVHTIAYCNEFIGRKNYNEDCAARIARSLAATNFAYNGRLANHVSTDNPDIRKTANTSLRWLRTAMDMGLKYTNYQVVRSIESLPALPVTDTGHAPQP